jgi:class 3 adenylate cyclase
MTLFDDLQSKVTGIFSSGWDTRDGRVVPDPSDLALGNDAVSFPRATILYADLHGSTALVNEYKWWFSGEIYKTFLHCASTLVRHEDGEITSYDGDRVMGVFIGDTQTTNAVRCAMRLTYTVNNIINPAIKARYKDVSFAVLHTSGIDTSQIRAARTGVRGDNDIVWIGRAANYAAKLTELTGATTYLTADAYDKLPGNLGGTAKTEMFTPYTWTQQSGIRIYGTTWHWKFG